MINKETTVTPPRNRSYDCIDSCFTLCASASFPLLRILREAARPFITDEVYNRVKHPFLAPPAFTNTKSKLHDLIQSTLRSRDLSRLWWVDQSSVIDDLDRLTEMVKSTDLNSQTGEEREKYLSMLLAADAKFLSIVSYAMLQKRFNVE